MTFKLSKYSTFFKNNNKTFLHSYSTKNNVEVDDKTLDFLNDYSFQRIDREILDNLIQNDILVPDFIQEEHLICEQLTQGSKLTLVFDRYPEVEELEKILLHKLGNHKDVCLLFIERGNIVECEKIIKSYYNRLKNIIILVLEYKEKLVFGDEIKVYKLKETDFVLNFKLTYSHLISKNLNFDEQYFKLFNSISFSHVSYRQHLKKFCLNNNVSPKEINSVNVLLSEHQYLKEFPISVLIVDEYKISILSQTSK